MTDTDRLRAAAAGPVRWYRTDDGRWKDTANAAVRLNWADDAPPETVLALLDELDTLRDEAERLRLRIANDQIRLRAAADAGDI
jgi:hypothetical protein